MASSGGELALARKDGAQVLTFDELHGDELHAFGFAQVVNANDVLVRDLARQDQFLLEARENSRIAGKVGPNYLQSDRAIDFEIVRFVDRAHAAHAQQCLDFVAAAEHAADFEDGRADRSINRTGRTGAGIARLPSFHNRGIVRRVAFRGRSRRSMRDRTGECLCASLRDIGLVETCGSHSIRAKCRLGHCGGTLSAGNSSSLLRSPRCSVRVVRHFFHSVFDQPESATKSRSKVSYLRSIACLGEFSNRDCAYLVKSQ